MVKRKKACQLREKRSLRLNQLTLAGSSSGGHPLPNGGKDYCSRHDQDDQRQAQLLRGYVKACASSGGLFRLCVQPYTPHMHKKENIYEVYTKAHTNTPTHSHNHTQSHTNTPTNPPTHTRTHTTETHKHEHKHTRATTQSATHAQHTHAKYREPFL